MATGDKYVMNGVWLTCDKGVAPSRFNVTPKPVQLYDEDFANELDKVPMVNILPFGVCSVTRTPCVPAPIMWERVMEDGLTVLGARPLLDTSKCMCGVGGKIAIHFTRADASAAVALDQQLDQVDAAADAAEEASGWAFWGGLAMGIGGAILVATGVGAPLGAAMITGAGYLMTASTIASTAAAVTKGVTKFARDPSKEVGLSIVGEVAWEAAKNYVMQKLGGKLIGKIANSKLGQRIANSRFGRTMEERFANACGRNRAGKPTCVGEPVDVATGKVISYSVDFKLDGPLPLAWSRVWYSTSAHEGALGHGWHHVYDEELYTDEELIILRLPDGRYTGAEPLPLGESVFLRDEKLTLTRLPNGDYAYQDDQLLTHTFAYCAATDSYKLVRLANEAAEAAIQLEYSAQGYLTRLIDSAGRLLSVEHDADGRLLAILAPHPTEVRGQVPLVRYGYDRQGRLVAATDALDQAWQFRYAGPLLVQATYKNGVSFYYEYDGPGLDARCLRTWGDEGIYACQLRYDTENHRTTVVDSVGAERVYEYDPELGVVTRLVDARGGVTLSEYNEYGEIVSETSPVGSETRYEYDDRGNCTSMALADGAKLQHQYDEQDRLTQLTDAGGGQWQWHYNDAGQLTQRISPTGRVLRYAYSAGRLTTITDQVSGRTTTLTYDPQRNLLAVHTSDGQQSRWLYDNWGRIRKSTDPRGNVQWREYDLLSRVTTVHEPDGNVRRFTYNALGNVTRAQDRHHDVQLAYRGLGRLIRRVEAGAAVEFLHDTEERLRAIVNEHGLAYRFELDAEGDVVTEVGFDGRTRHYQRDSGGRVTELLLPTGQRTRYGYDRADRMTTVNYADGSTETYQYNLAGQLVEATNDTLAVRFERDQLGNILTETQGNHTVVSTYDPHGARIGLHSSLGAQVRFECDVTGQVQRMATGQWQARFERDAQGLELQRTLSGNVRTRWRRDALGRPVEQQIHADFGTAERVRTYGWQPGARLSQLHDSQHGLTRFEHDAWGNLSASLTPDTAPDLRFPDAVGNLFGRPDRQDRRYGPAGQLLAAGGNRYTYDEAGNLRQKITAAGEEWSYSWNAAGQLTEVVRPDGSTVRFTYDALGRRVSKHHHGKVTRWVWDGNKPLHEWTELELGPGTVDDVITWLFEEDSFAPLAKLQQQAHFSIVTDHLGTPLQMHDQHGRPVWQADLDSYGRVRRAKGPESACPFRFQGQYADTETGLYYNRFRYYDPEAGTYISPDPIGLAGGSRLYGYVKDPQILIDPSGLNCETTAKLQSHADQAKAEASLSPKQQASIERSNARAGKAAEAGDAKAQAYHEMQAAKKERLYMGTQIDTRFKAKVDADPDLAHLSTTPRGKVGPDVYDPEAKRYWDLTTQKDWDKGTHQDKYDTDFGKGTGIFW